VRACKFFFFLVEIYFNTSFPRQRLSAADIVWSKVLTPATFGKRDTQSRGVETARRHARETQEKDLRAVQQMEMKMGIVTRWVPESLEWKAAAEKVSKRRYQRCLDNLEGLIVARMFELTKMIMSQTGKSAHITFLSNTHLKLRL
jgi:hypothetical protein